MTENTSFFMTRKSCNFIMGYYDSHAYTLYIANSHTDEHFSIFSNSKPVLYQFSIWISYSTSKSSMGASLHFFCCLRRWYKKKTDFNACALRNDSLLDNRHEIQWYYIHEEDWSELIFENIMSFCCIHHYSYCFWQRFKIFAFDTMAASAVVLK